MGTRDRTTEEALHATRSIRASRGYGQLGHDERRELDRNLGALERLLAGTHASDRSARYGQRDDDTRSTRLAADPFAAALDLPPSPIPVGMRGPVGATSPAPSAPVTPPPTAPTPAASPTETIGARARQALEAVDFPTFVAGLVQSTFQAIVDATAQQVREYARLVASLSHSVEDFSHDNVSLNQARDWLAQRHGEDLVLKLPRTGERGNPRLEPRKSGESPAWLEKYGLGGQELSTELVEGPLLEAARRSAGEERVQMLATMVLMGINRIVVDEGHIRAKLQFHARATDSVTAQAVFQTGGQQTGFATRDVGAQAAASTMVSTVAVNAQQDAALKTDLMGEVEIKFRTQTFDLERFADSPAIQLIQRHARWTPPTQGAVAAPTTPTETGRKERT